ncbi:MAG TPA: hypothetical protein VGF38_11535 [Ktedonobacterales bacterium]|jgi:hypothetical protein
MGHESPQGYPSNPGDDQQRPQQPLGYVLPSLAQPDSYRALTPLPVMAPDPESAGKLAIMSLALGIVGLVVAATMLSAGLSLHIFYANCLLAPVAGIVGVILGCVGLHSPWRYRVAIAGITISSVALAVAVLGMVYLMIEMVTWAMNT